MRRGLQTVYSERGTEMEVLIGDLQFIQAIRCFAEGIDAQKDMHLVKMVLDVGFHICCGEIDEIRSHRCRNYRKDGILILRACRAK